MNTERDTYNQIEYARETGREEGLKEGHKKGREEGREEGARRGALENRDESYTYWSILRDYLAGHRALSRRGFQAK